MWKHAAVVLIVIVGYITVTFIDNSFENLTVTQKQ